MASRHLAPSTAALILSVTFVGASGARAGEAAPAAILEKADEVRNPSTSFKMEVELKSSGSEDVSVFEVYTKGKDKTLIKTLAPGRDKGRNMLMLNEDMWAFIPNLKRAVRVGLNQKLNGQAANGDIGRMRWAGDYDAKLEKEEASTWTLFLTANKKGLTYDKIRAVIEKKSHRPLKAEYLSLAGKPLKFATFGGYKNIAGGERPTEIKIHDANKASDTSTIIIRVLEPKEFPDAMFSQNNLK